MGAASGLGLPVVTTPTLCENLSRFDGRSVATLRVVVERLREAGLFAVGSRGFGALHVAPEDCAALLLAGLVTDSPAASPRAVEVYSSLRRRPAPVRPDLPRSLGLVIQLPTLADTISNMIEFSRLLQKDLGSLTIDLTVSRPVPTTQLVVIDGIGRRHGIAEWIVDADRLIDGFYRPETSQFADRRHSTTITGATLFALGDLIRPESERVSA